MEREIFIPLILSSIFLVIETLLGQSQKKYDEEIAESIPWKGYVCDGCGESFKVINPPKDHCCSDDCRDSLEVCMWGY